MVKLLSDLNNLYIETSRLVLELHMKIRLSYIKIYYIICFQSYRLNLSSAILMVKQMATVQLFHSFLGDLILAPWLAMLLLRIQGLLSKIHCGCLSTKCKTNTVIIV